jgi:hypothetical protein
MAERAFARKIEKMGFADVWIGERLPFDIDRVTLFPLFTPAVVETMRRVLPPERQAAVATSVIAKATKPSA